MANNPAPTPERAIYGFVLYIFSFVLFAVFVVWAFVPQAWLTAVGLTYWPQKHWAVAIPVYFSVCIVFLYIFYTAYNFTITKPLNSINTFCDEYSKPVVWEDMTNHSVPPIGDLSITEVNRRLYGKKMVTQWSMDIKINVVCLSVVTPPSGYIMKSHHPKQWILHLIQTTGSMCGVILCQDVVEKWSFRGVNTLLGWGQKSCTDLEGKEACSPQSL